MEIPMSISTTAPNKVLVALALAIVKSKPEGVTVRAHILDLRSYFQHTQQLSVGTDGSLQLDQVAYWKSRYDDAERRYNELQTEVVRLQRLNDSLQQRSDMAEYLEKEAGSKKRRAGKSTSNRSVKRPKSSSNISDLSVMASRGSFGGDLDHFDKHGQGSVSCDTSASADETTKEGEKLVQHLYMTHMLYQKSSSNLSALASSLVQTTRSIALVVATIPRQYDQLSLKAHWRVSPQGKGKSALASTIEATARAFTSVLLGLGKLVDAADRQLANAVVCECILMFKVTIKSIAETSRLSAQTRSILHASNASKPNKSTPSGPDSGAARTLAHFLNAIMCHLKKNDRHHREMFEGMLFVLTEHIGKLLFYTTFERHRARTVEGDIALPSCEKKEAIAQEQEALTAIRIEATALVAVLQRAISLAPHHLNSPLSSGQPSRVRRASSITQPPTRASQIPLATHARDRLQRTLVMCMFGEQRDEFADVLRKPAALGSCPNVPKIEEKDLGTWFSGEVWRLVGWDLIGREDGW